MADSCSGRNWKSIAEQLILKLIIQITTIAAQSTRLPRKCPMNPNYCRALCLLLLFCPLGCKQNLKPGPDVERATSVNLSQLREITKDDKVFWWLGGDLDYQYFRTRDGFYRIANSSGCMHEAVSPDRDGILIAVGASRRVVWCSASAASDRASKSNCYNRAAISQPTSEDSCNDCLAMLAPGA